MDNLDKTIWQVYRGTLLQMQGVGLDEIKEHRTSFLNAIQEIKENNPVEEGVLDENRNILFATSVTDFNLGKLQAEDLLRTFDIIYFFLKHRGEKQYHTIYDPEKIFKFKALVKMNWMNVDTGLEDRIKNHNQIRTLVYSMLFQAYPGSEEEAIQNYYLFFDWIKSHTFAFPEDLTEESETNTVATVTVEEAVA